MRKVFIYTLYLLIVLVVISCDYETKKENAVKGVLKIGELKESLIHPLIDIMGEWEFYKDKFYQLSELPEKKKYVKMPYSWKGKGYGTYYLKIVQQPSDIRKVLVLEYIKSSCRIYINGKLAKEIGKVGKKRMESEPEGGIDFVEIPNEKNVHVILHVSNYIHEVGGVNKNIKITSFQGFKDYTELRLAIRVAVCAALAAFIINLLVMAVHLKERKLTLWFALEFTIILLFNILYIPGVNLIDKGLNEELNIRILMLLTFANPIIWIKIFKEAFDKYFPDIAAKILIYVYGTIFLLGLSLDLVFLYKTQLIFQILTYGTMVLFIYVNIKAIINGVPVAKWYLSAFLIIIGSFIFDGLVYAGIIESKISMSPISSLIFVLLVTAGTFRVYSKAFDLVEQQSVELTAKLIEVVKLNEEIKNTIEVKDEFLERTSHDMKSPLAGIYGMVEMMIKGESGHMSQAALNQLAIIGYSSRRLTNMINNVIDASRIKLNEIKVNRRPVNLSAVFQIVKKLSEKELNKWNIDLVVKIDKTLSVLGDEDKINQIFHNLLDNAMRHAQAKKIFILEKHIDEKTVEIVVRDDGIGIEETEQEQVFERYGRTANSYEEGSGLGLYISRGLCRIQGGDMYIEKDTERDGIGFVAQFERCSPVTKKSMTDIKLEETRELLEINDLMEAGKLHLNEQREGSKIYEIWIVDDEEANLEVAAAVLSRYKIRKFKDPKEVLDEIQYKWPNMILLDVMMPGGTNGYDVCREIRMMYNQYEVPIIFLTALSDTSSIVKGLEIGGNDFIVKPIDMHVLRAKVRTQISLSTQIKRYVALRGYSNKIAEFKDIKDMVYAIYELMAEEESVSDIVLFESERQVKRSKNGRVTLSEYFNDETKILSTELSLTKYDGKDYVIMDFTSISNYKVVIELLFEPDSLDIEYLKNAMDQIKATKKNLNNILSQTKTITIVNEINSMLSNVRYIKSDRNYCIVVYKRPKGKKFKEEDKRISFSSIRLYFGDAILVQIHKSYLVNKSFVRNLALDSTKKKLELDVDGEILPVGGAFKANVEKMVKEVNASLLN